MGIIINDDGNGIDKEDNGAALHVNIPGSGKDNAFCLWSSAEHVPYICQHTSPDHFYTF